MVPAPKGFIEASALSLTIRDTFSAPLRFPKRLVGVWYEPDAVADILNSGSTTNAAYYTAVLEKELETSQAAAVAMKDYSTTANNRAHQKFDLNDPATDKLVRFFEQAYKKGGNGVSLKIAGMTMLGAIAESPTFRADSMILVAQRSDESELMPYAMAVGLMQIGTQLVSLSAAHPFNSKASILKGNAMLLTWSKVVYDANHLSK
jgi:hypothetical protein